MLELKVNDFTIIAHDQNISGRGYTVLGARRTGPGDYEYVVAWMASLDDTFWSHGSYTRSLRTASDNYSRNIF